MRKGLVLVGLSLSVIGIAIGFYASRRNCLIAFLTEGYMSFWTGIELLAGFTVLAGFVIALLSFISKA